MCENKREQDDEFYAWAFNFDAGEVQYTTQLVTNKIRKPKPTKLTPRVWQRLGAERPIIIGSEPLLIGSDPGAPRYFAPAEPMRPPVSMVVAPAPRIVDEHPDWPSRQLLRGLRGDPGLVAGVLSLVAALAWWFGLAHGGEAFGIAQRGAGGLLVSMLVLYMPIYLCIASCICMVASILPELDFIAIDLQRRQRRHY